MAYSPSSKDADTGMTETHNEPALPSRSWRRVYRRRAWSLPYLNVISIPGLSTEVGANLLDADFLLDTNVTDPRRQNSLRSIGILEFWTHELWHTMNGCASNTGILLKACSHLLYALVFSALRHNNLIVAPSQQKWAKYELHVAANPKLDSTVQQVLRTCLELNASARIVDEAFCTLSTLMHIYAMWRSHLIDERERDLLIADARNSLLADQLDESWNACEKLRSFLAFEDADPRTLFSLANLLQELDQYCLDIPTALMWEWLSHGYAPHPDGPENRLQFLLAYLAEAAPADLSQTIRVLVQAGFIKKTSPFATSSPPSPAILRQQMKRRISVGLDELVALAGTYGDFITNLGLDPRDANEAQAIEYFERSIFFLAGDLPTHVEATRRRLLENILNAFDGGTISLSGYDITEGAVAINVALVDSELQCRHTVRVDLIKSLEDLQRSLGPSISQKRHFTWRDFRKLLDHAALMPFRLRVREAPADIRFLWTFHKILDGLLERGEIVCLCGVNCNLAGGCSCVEFLPGLRSHVLGPDTGYLPGPRCLTRAADEVAP